MPQLSWESCVCSFTILTLTGAKSWLESHLSSHLSVHHLLDSTLIFHSSICQLCQRFLRIFRSCSIKAGRLTSLSPHRPYDCIIDLPFLCLPNKCVSSDKFFSDWWNYFTCIGRTTFHPRRKNKKSQPPDGLTWMTENNHQHYMKVIRTVTQLFKATFLKMSKTVVGNLISSLNHHYIPVWLLATLISLIMNMMWISGWSEYFHHLVWFPFTQSKIQSVHHNLRIIDSVGKNVFTFNLKTNTILLLLLCWFPNSSVW